MKEKETEIKGEAQARKKILDIATGWYGKKESDGSHKEIIDIYNGHKPLARGYKVKYTDSWCAAYVSAAAIVAGYTDIIPIECGCEEMIKKFKEIGRWVEDDAYVPSPADIIFYDWQDNGKGDNKGHSDHVGMIVDVLAGVNKAIEGNKNNAVEYRRIPVNGRYIRGYGVPDYASKVTKKYRVGWIHDDYGWWYADTENTYLSNCWRDINGHRYYFNDKGYAVTGWQEINGEWYYFEPRPDHPYQCAVYVSDKFGAQDVGEF